MLQFAINLAAAFTLTVLHQTPTKTNTSSSDAENLRRLVDLCLVIVITILDFAL
jgi:hypothetical protein